MDATLGVRWAERMPLQTGSQRSMVSRSQVGGFFFGGAPDETPTTHKTTISCEFSQGPHPLGCTSPFTAHFSGLSLFSNPIFAFLECVSRKIFPLLLQHFFNAAPKTGACQFSSHAYVFPLFQANKTNVTYKILCPPEN